MQTRIRVIKEYIDRGGTNVFRVWFDGIKSLQVQATIDARLARVRLGNFGHCRSVGEGIHELKIDIGPGYRVYFALDGLTIVLLLCGGDKKSQSKDILKATTFWTDYQGG